MRNLLRALALRPDDRRLLVRAWWYLLVADLRLCRHSYDQVEASLAMKRSPAGPGEYSAVIRRVSWFVDQAAWHHLYPMTCLRRALVLQRLLAERGIVAELRIGVRKGEKQLDAHAWLEYHGEPVGETVGVAERFVPLAAPAWQEGATPAPARPNGLDTDINRSKEDTHGYTGIGSNRTQAIHRATAD